MDGLNAFHCGVRNGLIHRRLSDIQRQIYHVATYTYHTGVSGNEERGASPLGGVQKTHEGVPNSCINNYVPCGTICMVLHL